MSYVKHSKLCLIGAGAGCSCNKPPEEKKEVVIEISVESCKECGSMTTTSTSGILCSNGCNQVCIDIG